MPPHINKYLKSSARGNKTKAAPLTSSPKKGSFQLGEAPTFAKIHKNYKLSEDVVEFLDRAHFHLRIDRTTIIEELLRSKAAELNLPPIPTNKTDKSKKMKALLKLK